MSESLWRFVRENFDNTLPRMTAVFVKERTSATSFAYPTGDHRTGYFFDFSNKTYYDLPPKFRFDFAAYVMPGHAEDFHENRALFKEQIYYPSMFEREVEYTNLALKGTERFGRALDGSFSWQFDYTSRAVHYPFKKKLYSVIFSTQPFSVEKADGALCLKFDDMNYYIASDDIDGFGLFEHDIAMISSLTEHRLETCEKGHYLALCHNFDLDAGKNRKLSFGLSSETAEKAVAAAKAEDIAKGAEAEWAKFLNDLPKVAFRDSREKKAYYKSWVTIRNNYYDHKNWGHCITECLPVYKGLWQWAISSVEWHDDQNPELTSVWIKKAMDMLIDSQREDGYVTHAIYVDENRPGERWAARGTIQTPHLAWTALRYYHATGDLESVRRWYEPLKLYYKYISQSLDERFENLHLWAITSSFDTGIDTTAAFHLVTYGDEKGYREPYCYPAVFAAERYRYEVSLAQLAELFGEDPAPWLEAADLTRKACEEYLWDSEKKWYGVRHADKSLDTRVGVDGLFVYVYNMIDRSRAEEMKENFKKLIGMYGIRTVAEDEEGFYSDVYWRGPCWPKSASLGMHAAAKFYPDLTERVLRGVLNMSLKYPNIWECMDVSSGELAHSDGGHFCSPGMTSNVGAGDIIGSILASHGFDMYAMKMPVPLTEMENFRAGGMRLTLKRAENGYSVSATPCPLETATIPFFTPYGIEPIELSANEDGFIEL